MCPIAVRRGLSASAIAEPNLLLFRHYELDRRFAGGLVGPVTERPRSAQSAITPVISPRFQFHFDRLVSVHFKSPFLGLHGSSGRAFCRTRSARLLFLPLDSFKLLAYVMAVTFIIQVGTFL